MSTIATPRRVRDRRTRTATVVVALARLVPLAAVIQLVPLLVALDAHRLHAESPDILGPAALFTLVASFAVTPLATVTGWRWHVILRRDFALWAAGFAFTDLVIAASTEPKGWMFAVGGAAGIAAGTAAALLLVPLVITSNRRSMRLLGRYWKRLHLLVYPVLALIAVHLYFIGDTRGLTFYLILLAPLLLLRLPPVRRRVVAFRKTIRRRWEADRV